MFTPLLLALSLLPGADPLAVGPSTLRADEPPVRLWLNGDRRFEPGDRARVQVEARDDGYLLVLNYDTDGRVRVLFPLDPADDGFVRGGRRYEVRGDQDPASFVVGESGSGFVYVALSPDPWQLRGWIRGDYWDYDVVAVDARTEDPERDLTRLVEGVAGTRGFDYDLVEYFVADIEVIRYEYPRPFAGPGVFVGLDPWCDPYWESGWYCGRRSGAYLSFGRYYRDSWWSVGYGPSWYWPYSTGYYYRPYSYYPGSSYYTYHRPWVTWAPTYRPSPGQPLIVGRSRGYDIGRYTPWTFNRDDDRGAARPSGGTDREIYRPRGDAGDRARPAATPQGGGRPATERARTPTSQRARPSGDATARPAARPPAERPSAGRTPATGGGRPATPSTTRPRGRSRGGEDVAAAVQLEPSRAARIDDSPARVARAEPRGESPVARQNDPPRRVTVAPDREERSRQAPVAERPEPRRAAPAPASPPRQQAPAARRPEPSRAAPAAPPQPRRDSPARSRGGRQGG